MIIAWIFSVISLIILSLAKVFFALSPGTEPLILSLALISVSPWMIPVIHEIKKDISYIDGRIFFAIALAGLISTALALITNMLTFAEQSSILVYIMLVCGVVVELMSPLLIRLYQIGIRYITFPPGLKHEYQNTLREYSSAFVFVLGIMYVILLVGRNTLWDFDFSMLLFFASGLWIFFGVVLLTHGHTYGIAELYNTELRWLDRLMPTRYRQISYPALVGLVIAILVDIAFTRTLPLWMQITGVSLVGISVVLVSYMYPILSHYIRSRPYIQELFS